MDDAGVDAAEDATSLRAENVGAGYGEVVAGDGEVEVVGKREGDGVVEGEFQRAVVDEVCELD